MRQRNMLCPSQMMDWEMYQQGETYLGPPPSIHFIGSASIQQPSIRTMATASGIDAQHLSERYDNAPFYGITQYNGQPHHLDMGVATPANVYYSYTTPSSSSGVLPVPMNHGAAESVPSSSNYGVNGIHVDEYGRSSRIIDDLRGPCKRKNPECVLGNFCHYNASASPSTSVPLLNIRHPEGVAVIDAVNLGLPQFIGTSNPPIMETGPQNSLRTRSATTGLNPVPTHDRNHLSQANYVGPHFQPAGTLWLDQQLSSNPDDGGPSSWNQVPIPFMHGGNVGRGAMDVNMGMQRYHDSSSSRSSSMLQHPPPLNYRHQNHLPPPPVQRLIGHNLDRPHVNTERSYRLPSSSSHSSTRNPIQNGMEIVHRQPRPIPQTGFRIHRPRQGVISEMALRHHSLAHWRVLGVDEGVILDVPEFGNFGDQHRDMRLDIEDMSYEELLALGEQIGHVNNGLSEDSIGKQLKTRRHLSSGTVINLEEAGCPEKEVDFCIICQDYYKNQEKVGTLHCGHEYHKDCLTKWLLVKNVCPVCKSEALITGKNDV